MASARPVTVLSVLDAPVVTGPARGLVYLARALPPSVRLHVALLRGRGAPAPPDLATLAGGALDTTTVEEWSPYDPLVIARVAALALRLGAKVVQSHSYKPHLIALALRRALPLRWVGHFHGWTAENDKVRRYHRLDAWSLPQAHRVVAVAERAAHTIIDAGVPAGRVVVIPNAVSRADIDTPLSRDEARAALGLPHDRFVGVVVGRLSSEKGQDLALEALARVAADAPDLVLAFAGDGPDRASLEARTKALGLTERVRFLGHQKQVGVVYRAADLLVMPSRSEAMPNVLLEAMTVGLPAVATRVGGVPEVARDGVDAWVVDPESPEALAAALRDARHHPEARAARVAEARARAAERHDPARRADRYLDLYESVLARPLDRTR